MDFERLLSRTITEEFETDHGVTCRRELFSGGRIGYTVRIGPALVTTFYGRSIANQRMAFAFALGMSAAIERLRKLLTNP